MDENTPAALWTVLVVVLSGLGSLLVDTLRRYVKYRTRQWDDDTPEPRSK